MVKWEYKRILLPSSVVDNRLEYFGRDGWELISINKDDDWYHCVFKRPLEKENEPGYLAKQVRELREAICNYYGIKEIPQEES